jgi:hypothetical protein
METKKGMGVSTSAHPCVQAFALPLPKDKQRRQPTPSDYIIRYNTPTQTLYVALPLWEVSKLRSLNTQNDNVRKRLSLWLSLQTVFSALGFQ